MGRLSKRTRERERDQQAAADRRLQGTLFFFNAEYRKKLPGMLRSGGKKNFAFLFLRRPTAFRWTRTKFAAVVVGVVRSGREGRVEEGPCAAAQTNAIILLKGAFCCRNKARKQVKATQRNSSGIH